jgi:hypothetical protein
LHGLLCLLAVASLCRLSQRGYPLLACAVLPVAGLCCWRLARQRLAGLQLSWRAGQWRLGRGSDYRLISIHPSSTCLPWMIYLSWVETAAARRGSVFLFPDSACAAQLRQLRVRLRLER